MSVRRLSKTFISGAGTAAEKSSNFLAGYSPAIDEMDLIERVVVGSGGTSAIEFDLIPQTYQHLHLRGIFKTNRNTNGFDRNDLRFNDDSGNNYSRHMTLGNGASPLFYTSISQSSIYYSFCVTSGPSYSSIYSIETIDVYNYSLTNRNKTVKVSSAQQTNDNQGQVETTSGIWVNQSAINKITLFSTYNYVENTTVSLYGVRA